MIYMIMLGILVLAIFCYISWKQKVIVNGLTIGTATLLVFNVLLPLLYQVYHPEENYNYMYILIYYGVYYIALATGYYFITRSKNKKFNIEFAKDLPFKDSKRFSILVLILILALCLIILLNTPIEYLKNPRLLYEKTRLGFGPIYFGIAALINIYFIFAMFTRKKYYYVIFVFILTYFTGSKARMLIPIELLFMFYFYVKSNDRGNIKKVLLLGSVVVAVFIGVYALTAYYLPDKNLVSIVNNLAGYSDYNRNFSMLIDKMSESKNYFYGLISTENNFVSLVPRALWSGKPTIFGSFRLSYMIHPEWTLMFQGAPSFGQFGSIFADFGHFSLIIIAIYNFILGGVLAIAEKNFIKHKNPITFMVFITFMGVLLLDVGLGATTLILINLFVIFMIYKFVKYTGKINFTVKSKKKNKVLN